jgi:ATP-dependent DNA ligase
VRSVKLGGEGVICDPDGKSDFDRMRACFSRQTRQKRSCTLSTCWSLMAREMRTRTWAARRAALVSLLAATDAGIRLCEHIVDGAVVFRQACVMGLEGIVAKRLLAAVARDVAANG